MADLSLPQRERLWAYSPGRRRPARAVRHAGREPRSLTDARARIDLDAFPRPLRGQRIGQVGVPLALLGSDLAALVLTAVLVGVARSPRSLLFAAFILLSRMAVRHYRRRLHLSMLDDIPRAIGSTLAGVGLTLAAMSVVGSLASISAQGVLHERELVHRALYFLGFSLLFEALTMGAARHVRRRFKVGRRTLVIGAGRVGTGLSQTLLEHPELGLKPVGFADSHPLAALHDLPLPLLQDDLTRLASTIIDNRIDTAVMAFSGSTEEQVVDSVITAHQTGCAVLVVPRMFELHHDGPDVERVRGTPLLRLRPDPTLRPSWWLKRAVDIAVGFTGLCVLAIPLGLIACAVLVESGRPVLFWQERVGLDGRPFRLCKFRSLTPRSEDEQQTTWNIGSDPRVGKVGKLMRRTSVDEVPQLWNILRGQMSLVGPRPERPTFVRQFSSEHERYWARHRVPVGLTGLAQVNGLRGNTSIRERARYDNYYIANWSLWLDLKIVLLTVREVVGGRGR